MKAFHGSCFQEVSEVNRINIAETPILSITTCNDKKLISYFYRGMKAARGRSYRIFINWHLFPSQSDEVKDPQIVKVSDPLASEDNKIWIEEFSSMVSPLPRSSLVGLRVNFHPLLGPPVENANRVEPLLVRPSAPEDNYPIIISIVAHGAVGALRGDIACCMKLLPFHCDGVEGP